MSALKFPSVFYSSDMIIAVSLVTLPAVDAKLCWHKLIKSTTNFHAFSTMALFSSNNVANLGSLNIAPFLPTPNIPNIISEWAAVIPLICHLTSYHRDHQLTGRTALLGRLQVGVFPKLGLLNGIAKLLGSGPDFLDQASTNGRSSRIVWDVNWNTVFPCANGAASAIITNYALAHAKALIRMPEEVPEFQAETLGTVNTQDSDKIFSNSPVSLVSSEIGSSETVPSLDIKHNPLRTNNTERAETDPMPSSTHINENAVTTPPPRSSPEAPAKKPSFRRYQTLHVLQFSLTAIKSSRRDIFDKLLSSPPFEAGYFVLRLCLVSVLCMCGMYGTAAVLFCSSLSAIICRCLQFRRPPGFLKNNETNDACMLAGIHQNASIWYLYIGDRGVVDSLLNKTMILIPSHGRLLSRWLTFAHFFQLLAMTFITAQKGWDGVALLVLMLIDWVAGWGVLDHQIAGRWLRGAGAEVKAASFEFSGRTPLIGAVHLLSGSKDRSWMNNFVPPHARRSRWLDELDSIFGKHFKPSNEVEELSVSDQNWVKANVWLTASAVEAIDIEFDFMQSRKFI